MARVLVVDDDPKVREMISIWLRRDGHEVEEADDGREAVRLCRRGLPALVITDIVMPEQEGIETITQLRDEFPEVPIIAVSGIGEAASDYLATARSFGAARTFVKPLRLRDLCVAVKELTG